MTVTPKQLATNKLFLFLYVFILSRATHQNNVCPSDVIQLFKILYYNFKKKRQYHNQKSLFDCDIVVFMLYFIKKRGDVHETK